ncbi:uncharacterized protein LOC107641633 [Arachis ipaensis]|uniref:uncharacterized protein LOC107641633 n=1 Tax=Arachis ipaensis TaxID=130454 RepID=UPI0007AF23DC|nr:uncharacterized protein LOC107641633 [Arachis ipaensis]
METKFHIRSNSLPNGSHPSYTKVQEDLNKLRTYEATSASTSESISTGLSLLQDLYVSLDDLLNAASTQKVISHHQGDKWFEEILDGSIKVLDICGITRDTVMQIKENVQSLHSALRRRKADSTIGSRVAEYNLLTKEIKKNVKKLITSLKQSQFGASPLLNEDQDVANVISVLREVIEMNMSVFQSLLSFLAGPLSKSKAAKWMNKLMHKEEVNSQNSNELQCVDAALRTILNEGSNMKIAHERLAALENVITSLENDLENLFRHLIKTRVSLLNIMAQ